MNEEELPISFCENPECKWPIYKGDEVWRLGNYLFCHSECLIEGMDNPKVNKTFFTVKKREAPKYHYVAVIGTTKGKLKEKELTNRG